MVVISTTIFTFCLELGRRYVGGTLENMFPLMARVVKRKKRERRAKTTGGCREGGTVVLDIVSHVGKIMI